MESRIICSDSLISLEKMQNDLLKSGKWQLCGSITHCIEYGQIKYYRELITKNNYPIEDRLKTIAEYLNLISDEFRDWILYKKNKKNGG